MATIYTDALVNDAASSYRAGESVSSIARHLGCNPDILSKHLKEIGVEVTKVGRPSPMRIPMPSDFLARYESGESLYALAKSYGISRTALSRWLREAGVTPRSHSDAGLVRASRMTPEERIQQARAAHDAARGRVVSFDEKVHNALMRERSAAAGNRRMSAGEALMDGWLTSRNVKHVFQKAIGPYNVDFGIADSVAVEILGGNWHAVKSRRVKEAKRAEYILDRGWNMVFVWNSSALPMVEVCADQIVSIVNFSGSDPTSRGKYWVIRGDGEFVVSFCDDMDDRSLVVPSLCTK